ncbi:IS5/IS1182 family transposase, partial [Aeromonas salmonicida]
KTQGFGSGMTCWRHLRDWQVQGIWQQFHVAPLTQLHQAGHIDGNRVNIDSANVTSNQVGQETGHNPADRGKLG